MQIRMGSYGLPADQGGFVRPALARHIHICTYCDTWAGMTSSVTILTALPFRASEQIKMLSFMNLDISGHARARVPHPPIQMQCNKAV